MPESNESAPDTQWAEEWLARVADGTITMSQRKLTSVVSKGGGLQTVKAVAERKGVHLLLLEDDSGDALVAASIKPFEVIC